MLKGEKLNTRNILEYLEKTAQRYPERVAMSGGADSLTFEDLHRKARKVGSSLLRRGFCRKAVIVLMDKHPDTVCAFLGVLYSGCFYICIDPSMPDGRIRAIAERVQAAAVISSPDSRDRAALLYGRAELLSFEELSASDADSEALLRVRMRHTDSDPAYITFTSGSTGEPKGVCVSHRSLIDYADALLSALPFSSESVFGNQAPLYCDAPLKELLPMLCLGARVVFTPSELFMFPTRLCRFIKSEGINTLCFVPSVLCAISSLGALETAELSHLSLVCFGGEVMSPRALSHWQAACPSTEFYNLYGPTEATGMCCYHKVGRIRDASEPIPIGKPFKNTEILLIGEDGKLCRTGEEGEIYIRGACVALGYYRDAVATEAAFVQDPLQSAYPEKVYRTGDMAKYNERGELIYLGRRDRQIKLMGRRIEPSEIENAASECRGVIMPTVLFEAELGRLTLFYMGDAEERAVASHLSAHLPRYMLPREYRRVECMPRLENGKTDQRALAAMIGGAQ